MKIKLGISGHRFLLEEDKIIQGINTALDAIQDAFGASAWQIYSQLAEGADRLAANQALSKAQSELVVVLPLAQEDYLRDFQTPESIEEFLTLCQRAAELIIMPSASTREMSYQSAGEFILDQSEVLLVVWDGEPAQGLGGTGGIAARARQKGVPIAWVMAGNRLPGTDQPTSLGKNQGLVQYENFPD